MGNNTPNLNLYKVSPKEDGESTFNIDTMLNDNWDKIDEFKQEYSKLEDEVLNPKMAKTEKQVASIINLPNAVDGQASVGIEGRTVTNLVKNGNFETDSNNDGLADGWSYTSGFSKFNLDNYIQSFKLEDNKETNIFSYNKLLSDTNLYYLSAFIKANSTSGTVLVKAIIGNMGACQVELSSIYKKISSRANKFNRNSLSFYFDTYTNSVTNANINVKQVIAVNLTQLFGTGNEPSKEWCDQNLNFINGMQSTSNIKIKSIGKNLFHGANLHKYTSEPLQSVDNRNVVKLNAYNYNRNLKIKGLFKENTRYRISGIGRKVDSSNTIGTGGWYIEYTDGTNTSGSRVWKKDWTEATLLSDANKTINFISTYNGSNGSTYTHYVDLNSIQLEEGSTATSYEPYKESISYITLPEGVEGLHSLPNGVKDEVTLNGKLIKRVGKVIVSNNFTYSFTTSYDDKNIYVLWVLNFLEDYNAKKSTSPFGDAIATNNLAQFKINDTSISIPYELSLHNTGALYFTLPKDYIDANYTGDLSGCLSYLNDHPITLIYQLAEPQIYDLAVPTVTCFKDGTIYIESVEGNAEYVVPETQIIYPVNTAGALNSNTMAINQLSNQYQLSTGQQFYISNEQKMQILGQQITQLKLGGM